jgi:hypothetical protein
MFALNVRRLVGELEIFGHDIPFWKITETTPADFSRRPLRLGGHFLDAVHIASLIRRGLAKDIVLSGLGFQLENYAPATFYQNVFRAEDLNVQGYGQEHVVINVRGAEILRNTHPDYGPVSFSYFDAVIENAAAKPVFLGQLGDDFYSDTLRKRYPEAEFQPSQGALADFQILRQSHQISVAVSTFSWLAVWLSSAQIIHYPLSGMLNPLQRPDIGLTPIGDARYRFYAFETSRWTASSDNIAALSAVRKHPVLSIADLNTMQANARRRTRLTSIWKKTKVNTRARWSHLLQNSKGNR